MMESIAITILTNVHLTHVRTEARVTTISTAITVHAYKAMVESTAITTLTSVHLTHVRTEARATTI